MPDDDYDDELEEPFNNDVYDLIDEDGTVRPYTLAELRHALDPQREPEKPMPSARRGEKQAKKKERPPMQLPAGKYLTVKEVDARLAEVSAALDENIDLDGTQEEHDLLDDEQTALYRHRFALAQESQTAQSETKKEINRLKAQDEELQARENQEGISLEVKVDSMAQRQLARERAEALERRLPYLGKSDEDLSAAIETSKIRHEELTEKANALPAGSARRAKAQWEADEAKGRYLQIDAELRQRKQDAAWNTARTVRFTAVADRELRAEAQRRVNELVASGDAEPWEIDRAKLEASQPPSREQIAAKVPEVAAAIDARVERIAKESLRDRPGSRTARP